MAIEYTLKIQQIDTLPEHDGKQDVVRIIRWVYLASDGDNSVGFGDSTTLDYDPENTFTPYGGLTKEQVEGWVMSSMTPERLQSIKDILSDMLAIKSKPLPWVEEEIVAPAPGVIENG